MDTPESRAKILEAEVSALKDYLASLSPEDLQRPSACVDWSVADVVGHLAGQEHASRVLRGLQGDFSPPEGSPAVADHDEDRFARLFAKPRGSGFVGDAGIVIAAFYASGDQVICEIEHTGKAMRITLSLRWLNHRSIG